MRRLIYLLVLAVSCNGGGVGRPMRPRAPRASHLPVRVLSWARTAVRPVPFWAFPSLRRPC